LPCLSDLIKILREEKFKIFICLKILSKDYELRVVKIFKSKSKFNIGLDNDNFEHIINMVYDRE